MSDTNKPQPYPAAPASGLGAYGTPMPREQARPVALLGPPPARVMNAVRLMFLSAAVGIAGLVALVATKSSLRSAIASENPNYDSHKLDTAVNAAVGAGVVVGVILIVFYLLLALRVRKGKNWARIVAWVMTGLLVLSALSSFAQPAAVLSRSLSLVGGALDIAIIVLLAGKDSNAYFRRRGDSDGGERRG